MNIMTRFLLIVLLFTCSTQLSFAKSKADEAIENREVYTVIFEGFKSLDQGEDRLPSLADQTRKNPAKSSQEFWGKGHGFILKCCDFSNLAESMGLDEELKKAFERYVLQRYMILNYANDYSDKRIVYVTESDLEGNSTVIRGKGENVAEATAVMVMDSVMRESILSGFRPVSEMESWGFPADYKF
jgi:hypothetical protein